MHDDLAQIDDEIKCIEVAVDKIIKIGNKISQIPKILFSDDEILYEDLVELVPLSLVEHVIDCEALPLTCIYADDVDPLHVDLLECIVECETLPLTCIHTNYVKPIYSSLVEPIYSNSMEIIYPNLVELAIECEDITLAYISMDMVEKHDIMEYSCQYLRV